MTTTKHPERWLVFLVAIMALPAALFAQDSRSPATSFQMHPGVTRAEVIDRTLGAFTGMSRRGVDAANLHGKVLCGYQGWFSCPRDGSGRGWYHWQKRGEFRPGSCSIDLWPDVSELAADERFPTPFIHADGSQAEVYSPLVAKSVQRHFKWMEDYGIDGVFVQRFAVEVRHVMGLYHVNTVLANCRAGANAHGRVWAVMYDLSGLGHGGTQVVIHDWKMLVDRMRLGRDQNDRAYLRHRGKPVVAVWGIGFNDGRQYTLDECAQLVDFLSHDPNYGGNSVMVGVPTHWRTLRGDSVADDRVHGIVRSADVVSPWMVGRFSTPDQLERISRDVWELDLKWCQDNGKDYLPVVFPGFSWHNMKTDAPLDQIPRLGGRFLWKQYVELHRVGATMVYQAMFDELDEGTAIFKCTNNPPVGASQFLDYEGLPSDHYLWLAGQGGRLIRGEIHPRQSLPDRQ
jgi:hypothetical protein